MRTSSSSIALCSAVDLGADLGERRRVGLGLGQLEQHAGVVEPGPQPLQPVDLACDVGQPGGDLLRARLVVPEVGRGRLLLQLGLVPAQPVEIEHALDVAQGGVEGLELFGEVGSGHDVKTTPPGRFTGRAVAGRAHFAGRDLQPAQRGLVVGRRRTPARRRRTSSPSFLASLACSRTLASASVWYSLAPVVEGLQLAAGVLLAERDPQGDRVAQRLPAGRLGEPPAERALAGGGDRVGLAGPRPGLAEPDVTQLGQRRQFAVDLAARHRPVRPEPALGGRHQLSAGHRPIVQQPEQSGRCRVDSECRACLLSCHFVATASRISADPSRLRFHMRLSRADSPTRKVAIGRFPLRPPRFTVIWNTETPRRRSRS